jgi:hypothetical protein
MTNTDLSILADAISFALIVTIGGLVVYAVARAVLRRTRRQMLIAGLPAVALVAVALAGTAVWPFAREGVNEAVGVRLDDSGRPLLSAELFGSDPVPLRAFAGVSDVGHPVRVLEVASIGSDGGVQPAALPGGGPPDGGAAAGSGGESDGNDGSGDAGDGGSGGGGTDPSPTVEPSPTGEPSPTEEPSPTGDPSPTGEPSPTPEPSPTDDPPGPPWGSPGPPPKTATSSS